MRIIGKVLVKNETLLQSRNMRNHRKVGDLENALYFLNQWQFIDEIIVVNLALPDESFPLWKKNKILDGNNKPISYSGGLSHISEAREAIRLGFDKLVINSEKNKLQLLDNISEEYGSQSIILAADICNHSDGQMHEFHWKTRKHSSINNFIELLHKAPFGEVMLNSVNEDGGKAGLNLEIPAPFSSFNDTNFILSGGCTIEQLSRIKKNRSVKFGAGIVIGTALWHENLEGIIDGTM